ncbi:MAG: ABC transporter substrate-binding protein [Leptospiraceae bacterium]|nr:ABC transporter substrate-binding protein [Leptospiraceae bacterium]MDW8306545.1 ABC transporter substrate-binding protein [Leptospiraceae bacterium]
MRDFALRLYCIFSFVFWLSCQGGGDEPAPIRYFLRYRVQSLDPIESVDEASGIVLNLLHRRLYRLGSYGRLEGDLVADEEVQASRVILRLREAYFQKSGKKLHADDVVFCLQRLRDSGRQSWVLSGLRKIKARGADKVVLELNGRRGLWKSLRFRLTLPKTSIYSKEGFLSNGYFDNLSPYRLVLQTTERILLKSSRNAVELLVLPDESSRYFFFAKKQLTIYEAEGAYRHMPYEEELYWPYELSGTAVLYGAIVSDFALLGEKSFRKALNYAFDRKTFCEKVALGSCRASEAVVPEEWGVSLPEIYHPHRSLPHFKVAADYRIFIFTPPDRERQNLSRILQQILKKMGVNSYIHTMDLPSLIRNNNERKPGIYLFKWLADYPHPENFLEPLFHSRNIGVGGNRAYYVNNKVDQLIDRGDYSPRKLFEIQRIIQEDAPWLFVGHLRKKYLFKTNGGFYPEPQTYFWDWQSFFGKAKFLLPREKRL